MNEFEQRPDGRTEIERFKESLVNQLRDFEGRTLTSERELLAELESLRTSFYPLVMHAAEVVPECDPSLELKMMNASPEDLHPHEATPARVSKGDRLIKFILPTEGQVVQFGCGPLPWSRLKADLYTLQDGEEMLAGQRVFDFWQDDEARHITTYDSKKRVVTELDQSQGIIAEAAFQAAIGLITAIDRHS